MEDFGIHLESQHYGYFVNNLDFMKYTFYVKVAS